MTWQPIHLVDKPYHQGADVRKAQVLLSKHHYLPYAAIDGVYGPVTAAAVHRAKFLLGYRTAKLDTTFGPYLHAYLSGKATPSLAMRARARLRRPKSRSISREFRLRSKIVGWAWWGIEHTAQISYSQGPARMAWLSRAGHLPLATDCSASSTLFYKWAGAPDPNGLGYNGSGYTGTIVRHCRQISMHAVQAGDLVVYGDGDGHHVCVVMKGGTDPMLESHGQNAGPLKILHSVEHSAQGHCTVRWYTLPKW